jgi:RNA 3'-terminal phosphate cyclase (ATP)
VALTRIRAGRPRPGLQPQHLAVVRALAVLADARVEGAALGATELAFVPRGLRGGAHRFDVGAVRASAGSTTLLAQALLLPLARAPGPARLVLVGGTHVPWSPPAHYLAEVFLPALAEAGLRAEATLRRWGFHPAGGGELEVAVTPGPALAALEAAPPDPAAPVGGLSAVAGLPPAVAERQRQRARDRLAAAGVRADLGLVPDAPARGPGSFLFLAHRGRAGFSALGRRGVPAERVADEAVEPYLAYRASGAAVDGHLADQLVPFLALARAASAFTCPALSSHLRTVAWVVEALGAARVELTDGRPARVRVVPADGSA